MGEREHDLPDGHAPKGQPLEYERPKSRRGISRRVKAVVAVAVFVLLLVLAIGQMVNREADNGAGVCLVCGFPLIVVLLVVGYLPTRDDGLGDV